MSKRGMSRRGFAAAVAGAPLLAQQAQDAAGRCAQSQYVGAAAAALRTAARGDSVRGSDRVHAQGREGQDRDFPHEPRARHRRDI